MYISKSIFKAKALEIFRDVEASGEPVIVTDFGTPRLEVRRIEPEAADTLAQLRGSVLRYDNPFEPVGEEDWNSGD